MDDLVSFIKILERKIGLGIEKIKLQAVKVLRRVTAKKEKMLPAPGPFWGGNVQGKGSEKDDEFQ